MYNSNTRPLALRFLPPKTDGRTILAGVNRGLFKNHLLMCTTFSILHGIVDGTLAFVVAELGESLGSWASFLLYVFFCISALFLAKPLLYFLGPKQSIQFGSRSLFTYILTFFIAILCEHQHTLRWTIFLLGGAVGGIGAGVLWSGQGTYFTVNALRYSTLMGLESSVVTAWFASMFATMYLSMETIFKALASFVFFSTQWDSWLPTTFGLYIVIALVAMEMFRVNGKDLRNADPSESEDKSGGDENTAPRDTFREQMSIARGDALAVVRIMSTNLTVQLLLPFQVCFGLSTGLFAFYVNARVVHDHHGSGYIGILSALSTVVACFVAPLSGCITSSNDARLRHGRFAIMVVGALCFIMQGLAVLSATSKELSNWGTLVFMYIIHGMSRGIWECTNKEEISRAFHNSEDLPAAFAAMYVTSGGTTALGFMLYQFFNKSAIGSINFLVPVFALLTYCYYKLLVEPRSGESGTGPSPRGGAQVNGDEQGGGDSQDAFSVHSVTSLEGVVLGGDDARSLGMQSPGSSDRKKTVFNRFTRGRDRVKKNTEQQRGLLAKQRHVIYNSDDDDEDDYVTMEGTSFIDPNGDGVEMEL